jgi:hypothetical protein
VSRVLRTVIGHLSARGKGSGFGYCERSVVRLADCWTLVPKMRLGGICTLHFLLTCRPATVSYSLNTGNSCEYDTPMPHQWCEAIRCDWLCTLRCTMIVYIVLYIDCVHCAVHWLCTLIVYFVLCVHCVHCAVHWLCTLCCTLILMSKTLRDLKIATLPNLKCGCIKQRTDEDFAYLEVSHQYFSCYDTIGATWDGTVLICCLIRV